MKFKSTYVSMVHIISLVSLIIFLHSPAVRSQAGGLSLDHVDGIIGSDSKAILAGAPITFYIRFTNAGNPNEAHVTGASNGFRVYSPDGAVWSPITWLPEANNTFVGYEVYYYLWGEYPNFDDNLFFNPYSVTGEGADTIGLGGDSKLSSPGIFPGFSEVVYTISTQVELSELGKTLCLDSCFYPPSNEWNWGTDLGAFVPTWDGPHCFEIKCCDGRRGDVNYDPENKTNISDVAYLTSYLFGIPQGPEPVCVEEANANGDIDEKTNVADVSYLVAWLFGIPQGPEPPACP